jgi:uncharacterized membrane protein
VTSHELFKLLHVLGAIAWLGGGLGLLLLNRQLVRAGDLAGVATIGQQSQALGTLLFMPASLVTIASGVAMVATSSAVGFGDLWILIGFGGILASGIAQMAVAAPADRRFAALLDEHGADHPDVASAARRLSRGSMLDLGLLVVVVWAMVAKPTW